MNPLFSSSLSRCITLMLTGVTFLSAAPELDMTRLSPVAAEVQIPVLDFLRPGLLLPPDLNSSGTHVAAMVSGADGATRVMITDLTANKTSFVGGDEDTSVYSFNWLDSEHFAYGLATVDGFPLGLMVANVAKLDEAYPIYQYGSVQIVGVPKSNPMKPLVWLNGRSDDEGPRLVELDASLNSGGFVDMTGDEEAQEAGWKMVVERNEAHVAKVVPAPGEGVPLGYLANGAGNAAFAFTRTETGAALWTRDGEGWLRSPVDPSKINILESGDKPGELVVLMPAAGGKPSAAHYFDTLTGNITELIIQDSEYDFTGTFYRDPASHVIAGAFYERNGPTTRWFDKTYQDLQKLMNEYFPGRVVRLLDANDKGAVFLVAVTSDRHPIAYYTFDLEKKTVANLQNSQPWIDAERMQPMNILKYTTGDGLKLDAYVTLPAGASKTNQAPLVVMPHGGPWAKSSWGFQGEVQFFVSRGYAVLQPNYRGSLGYDWMFSDADRVDFLKMHDDVTRAVKTTLKTGMIDASRVGIVGGGFGGYLALTGLIKEPGIYACGVTNSGIHDWKFLATELGVDRNYHPVYGEILTLLGDPGTQAAKFDAISPAAEVGKLKDPIMTVREKDATGLERDQSVRLANALKTVGANYKEVLLEGSLAQLSTQVTLLTEIERFLASNLGMPSTPMAAPAAAGGEETPTVEFKLNK